MVQKLEDAYSRHRKKRWHLRCSSSPSPPTTHFTFLSLLHSFSPFASLGALSTSMRLAMFLPSLFPLSSQLCPGLLVTVAFFPLRDVLLFLVRSIFCTIHPLTTSHRPFLTALPPLGSARLFPVQLRLSQLSSSSDIFVDPSCF
ncbi:hypothetical protein GDO81_016549 [Engystomops pustulosus]|uniref:Transmembrane protein n=1 Tax=Engystomops pustulosus TaxID=76066 RepID=A0AAV7AZ07_ENGPU|nr:hypothetical protein GDO81_016549 [Engystomops pustulosus]